MFQKSALHDEKISYNAECAEKCHPKQIKYHPRKNCCSKWKRCHLFQKGAIEEEKMQKSAIQSKKNAIQERVAVQGRVTVQYGKDAIRLRKVPLTIKKIPYNKECAESAEKSHPKRKKCH